MYTEFDNLILPRFVTFSPELKEYILNIKNVLYIYYNTIRYKVIRNVMYNNLLANCSFSFGRMITKRGRITKWCSESDMVKLKFGLKLFCLSSCHFYGRCHI